MSLATVLEQASPTAAGKRKPICRCLECGEAFERTRADREFCSRACVRNWTNRRAVRGMEIYDLVMVTRFERDAAKKHKVWRRINRLASLFRDEDKARRDGRRSWRRLRAVIESKPFLSAE